MQSENIKRFKYTLMKHTKSNERLLFSIHDPEGVQLLYRLGLNFSHLNKHKFRHSFKECVRARCGCRLQIESTQHFFLRWHFYDVERSKLFNIDLAKYLYNIDLAINRFNKDSIINLVLFGSGKYRKKSNRRILLLNCVTHLKTTSVTIYSRFFAFVLYEFCFILTTGFARIVSSWKMILVAIIIIHYYYFHHYDYYYYHFYYFIVFINAIYVIILVFLLSLLLILV